MIKWKENLQDDIAFMEIFLIGDEALKNKTKKQ